MNDQTDSPVTTQGSPLAGNDVFGDVQALLRVISDPVACQARADALEKALGATSAAQARLAKDRARFEADQQAGREKLEADRASLNKVSAAHAVRVAEHNQAVSEWREISARTIEDAARWHRQNKIGIDLTDPDDMRRLHNPGCAHQGQLDEALKARPAEPPQETRLERTGYDGAVEFPASTTLTRSVPQRRGAGRRV